MMETWSMVSVQRIHGADELDTAQIVGGVATAIVIGISSIALFTRDFLASGRARRLGLGGVLVFALVGEDAELAHDALDWELEGAGVEGAATTWHDNDALEVAEYMRVACGGVPPQHIIVWCGNSHEMGLSLERAIKATVG